MITQLIIVLTGALAIWLTQQPNEGIKKYACIVGLIGQPFWFYSAIQNDQWGISLLTCFYTYAWWIGFKNHWTKKGSSLWQQKKATKLKRPTW